MAADRLRSELERLATRDSLTGALARGALLKACQDELSRIARGGPGHSGMALMMVDLDHFKQVNDRHGHLVGDRVLSDFAERVHALLRPHDLSRIQMAFFTANGMLALVMFAAGCVDLYLLPGVR